jgi:Fe-S-cluster containining protein
VSCRRCGTCCKKGGPTLHKVDRPLVERGDILLKELFTIRAGEMAYDNVRNERVTVAGDHIKLKGTGDRWTCCRYDDTSSACRDYEHRPLECRRLKCWDTAELEKIYGRDLLSREDLLANVAGLWDLVSDHQRRCSYEAARRLIEQMNGGRAKDARSSLLKMVQYDIEIRRLVADRGGGVAGMLEFLFGRPMSDTLKAEGLNLKPNPK